MNYISLCSGVEAASVAWIPLGWRPLAFAEIDPFCCAVLSHHFPEVPNLGDITKLNGADLKRPNVLIAGTPCQPFSVAGQRMMPDSGRIQKPMVLRGTPRICEASPR